MKRAAGWVASCLVLAACGSDAPAVPAPSVAPPAPATVQVPEEAAAPEEEPSASPVAPDVTPPTAEARESALHRAEEAPARFEALAVEASGSVEPGEAEAALVVQPRLYSDRFFTPDGRFAVARAAGGLAALVDLATGRVRATAAFPLRSIDFYRRLTVDRQVRRALLAASPDPERGEFGTRIVLWDLTTGAVETVFESDTELTDAWIMPDGRSAVLIRREANDSSETEAETHDIGRIQILSFGGGRRDGDAVDPFWGGAHISRDGSRFTVRSREDGARLYDGADGRRVASLMSSSRDVAFHPSSTALVTYARRSVFVLAAEDGRLLYELEPGGDVRYARWSEDGARLLIRTAERVHVYHATSGLPLWSYEAASMGERERDAWREAWSADAGVRYRSAGSSIERLDGQTGARVGRIPSPAPDARLQPVPGGERLIASGFVVDLEGGGSRRLGGDTEIDPVLDAAWYGAAQLGIESLDRDETYWSTVEPSGAREGSCRVGTTRNGSLDVPTLTELFWPPGRPPILRIPGVERGPHGWCPLTAERPDGTLNPTVLGGGRWVAYVEEDTLVLSAVQAPDDVREIALEEGEQILGAAADGMSLVVGAGPRLRVLRRPGGREVCRLTSPGPVSMHAVTVAPDGRVMRVRRGNEGAVYAVGDECGEPRVTGRHVHLLPGGRAAEVNGSHVTLRAGAALAPVAELEAAFPVTMAGPVDADTFYLAGRGRARVIAYAGATTVREINVGQRISVHGAIAVGCRGDRQIVVDLRTGVEAGSAPCLEDAAVSADGRWLSVNHSHDVALRRADGSVSARLRLIRTDAGWGTLVVTEDGRVGHSASATPLVYRRRAGPLREASLAPVVPTPSLLRSLLRPAAP